MGLSRIPRRGVTEPADDVADDRSNSPGALNDLQDRGLYDDVMVVWVGEFGRTPRISSNGGRDHWPQCYTAVLAGGGAKKGYVYGASDKLGAYPTLGQAAGRPRGDDVRGGSASTPSRKSATSSTARCRSRAASRSAKCSREEEVDLARENAKDRENLECLVV